VLPQFYQSGPEGLPDAGRALYNMLFPANAEWLDAVEARKAFEDLMRANPPIKAPTLAKPAPSLFVRTVLPSLQSDVLMPVALMNVKGTYVGDSMRVELPLPVQSYRKAARCVSRWVMTLPPQGSGEALDEALTVVASRADGWKSNTTEMYRDIASTRRWLSDPKTDTEPSAFIITSHHNQQSLFFKTTDPLIPSEIERTFAPSSIAVLNGCGTGEPGAIDIINQLSERKVDAVIATATTVKGRMAGSFLACLADTVMKAGPNAVTLGQLHFVTVRCLADQKGKDDVTTYGARALAYMLIGNGNLWLCSPQKGP
jgi:hypothetical protein